MRYLLQGKNSEVIEIIPPASNTDIVGKGFHHGQPSLSDFVDAIFQQLQEEKMELIFGFSEIISKATPEVAKATFDKINP